MLGACGPTVGVEDDTGSTSTGSSTTASPTTTVGTSTASTTVGPTTDDVPPDPSVADVSTSPTDTSDSTTYTDDESDDDQGCAFYGGCPIDASTGPIECDIYAQDCPRGEKCMPWANDGGDAWNATRCVPLDPSPGQPGDVCTVEGSAVSGIDSCDASVMCWDVDPETNVGHCVAFCTGSPADPSCADPANACATIDVGVLNLCLPSCDPLMQDCADDEACYAVADVFVCVTDGSTEKGMPGDPCDMIDGCDGGSTCVSADVVPDCVASGCCSPFCSLAAGDTPCTDALGPGVVCVPWFEEGAAPPGMEDLGACGIPD